VVNLAGSGLRPECDPLSLMMREARIVGIKDFSTPTLEAVDRRRSQLWTVAFAGLVCMAAAVALLSSKTGVHLLKFTSSLGFRIGTVMLVAGMAAYVIEKERHLRRLAKLLVDERVLGAALSNRLKELAMLYEAGKAMNSVLVIDDVLHLILWSAFELLEASSGSIMLLEEPDSLVVVCQAGNSSAHGARTKLGQGIAGKVAKEREPVLINGTVSERRALKVDSAVCVPLLHREELLGVLNLNGAGDRVYTEHDLRAVSMFAEHAAIAVANARLYESERALSARLSHQVVHDPLTGLANRVLVTDRLEHALVRSSRTGSWTAALFIDVDDFKLVNDQRGHKVGDAALSVIAKRLAECVRSSDTVGRFGGDEFIVVCEDLSGQEEAKEVSDRILEAFDEPLPDCAGQKSSASIGVAVCGPGETVSAEELIHEADQAMYRAKASGKARTVISSLCRA
jgi:diguanylate cyclase (GGDEF)-like protein